MMRPVLFAVNVLERRPGKRPRASRSVAARARVVHWFACQYARSPRYRLTATEVTRLESRRTRGDDDGRTRFCAYCRPHRVAGLITDAT